MQAGADRGQSIQVGAVLLFGVLVILLATWQAVVVPQENEGVEFDHSRAVQGDVHELRNAIVSRGDGGTTVGVDIQLGTTYPTRILFVNPDPPTGAIRTVGTASDAVNVSVRNASAAGDAGDFWGGRPRNYTTGGMVYRPSYNRYDNAPRTTYENSLLYNDFGRRNLTLAGQALIEGNRVTLVTLNGTLDRTRADATTVDVRPVTASRSRLGVVNATAGERLTIGVPTQLSAQNWTTLLEEELVANGGHVTGVSTGRAIPGTALRTVNIHLERGVQYRLSLARVGVGTNVNTTVPARYLTRTAGNGSVVPEDTTRTLEVRTWDRFNNPVGGVSVQANTSRADSGVEVTDASDDDGRIELRYEAPTDIDGGAETDQVNVSMTMQPADAGSGFDPATPANVTFDLTVDNADRSGTGGGGGGGGAYLVNWTDPSGQTGVTCPDGPNEPCKVDGSQTTSVALTMETDPVAADAPVNYGLNNTSVATKNETRDVTNDAGKDTVGLTVTSNGSVAVYTDSGGNSDTIEFVVENVSGTVEFTGTAAAFDSDGDGQNSVLAFNVSSTYSSDVTLTAISVNSTSTSADILREGNSLPREVLVDSDEDGFADGFADALSFDIGPPIDLDSNAVLAPGLDARWNLGEFREDGPGNSDDRIDMVGEDVTITVFYLDPNGITRSTTFTIMNIPAG